MSSILSVIRLSSIPLRRIYILRVEVSGTIISYVCVCVLYSMNTNTEKRILLFFLENVFVLSNNSLIYDYLNFIYYSFILTFLQFLIQLILRTTFIIFRQYLNEDPFYPSINSFDPIVYLLVSVLLTKNHSWYLMFHLR